MPSHIFTRTGSWKESIETKRRSMRAPLSTGSIAEALNAADYAEYAYLQRGLNSHAQRIVDSLPLLESRFDVNAVTGAAPGSAGVFALAAIPARYALERSQWAEAAALKPKTSAFPWTDAMIHFARALGASRTGDLEKAKISIDSLGAIRRKLADRDEMYWSELVAIQELEATAWLDLKSGRTDSALTKMREAVKREDATEKNAVTPGPLAPSRELLGDMLMELHRPAEALIEYQQTLTKEPNRRRAIVGGIAAAEGARNKMTESDLRRMLKSL
jgi:tetratricopeptide (TPR) repeat protein